MLLVLTMLFAVTACQQPDNTDTPGGGSTDTPGGGSTDTPGGGSTDTPTTVDYTVYVQDTNGTPISGVYVQVCTDAGCRLPKATDSTGKAVFTFAPDNFKAQLSSVPTGFLGDTTVKYAMVNNTAVITLEPLATYTVMVKDQNGQAVAGAVVHHAGVAAPVTTDASGLATFECAVREGYKVFVISPDGYEACTTVYTYSGNGKSVSVTLTAE